MTIDTQTHRASPRQPVLLDARCRKSSWIVHQVELANISEGGCCMLGRIDGLAVGDEVTLRIADLRSVPGEVKWVKGREAGLAFAEAIDPRTIEDLAATYTIGEPRQAGIRSSLNAT